MFSHALTKGEEVFAQCPRTSTRPEIIQIHCNCKQRHVQAAIWNTPFKSKCLLNHNDDHWTGSWIGQAPKAAVKAKETWSLQLLLKWSEAIALGQESPRRAFVPGSRVELPSGAFLKWGVPLLDSYNGKPYSWGFPTSWMVYRWIFHYKPSSYWAFPPGLAPYLGQGFRRSRQEMYHLCRCRDLHLNSTEEV